MSDESRRRGKPQEAARFDNDEIEILEVLGVDDTDAPPAGESGDDGEDGGDGDGEIVLSFDDEPAELAEPATPARATASATARRRSEPAPDDSTDRERLIRLQADLENLRKRIDRERADYHRHATAKLVTRLLPTIDNFERALASDDDGGVGGAFRDGVGLIYRQLIEELRREGLKAVDCVGQPFDPSQHEAVATEAAPDQPLNTVLEEFQRGYFLQERLLRPALVKVCVAPKLPDGLGGSGEES